MDVCKYCKKYHHEYKVCSAYIEAMKKETENTRGAGVTDLKDFVFNGFIKARGDFGDNTANLGSVYFGVYYGKTTGAFHYMDYVYVNRSWWFTNRRLLEVKPGVLCRHPDAQSWTSSDEVMSEDQAAPFLMAAKLVGDPKLIKRFIIGHAKRGFLFMTNTRRNHAYPKWSPYARADKSYGWKLPDLTLVTFLALLCRCSGFHFLPVIWLADLVSIIKSYQYLWASEPTFLKKGHYGDLRKHIMRLIFNNLYCPTYFNTIAIKVLAPIAHKATRLWFSSARGEPPIYDIMKPALDDTFGVKD